MAKKNPRLAEKPMSEDQVSNLIAPSATHLVSAEKKFRESVEREIKGDWRPPFIKTIHTYFVACAGIDYETELRLVLEWVRWWTAKGYECRILNQKHAESHPLYAEYLRKVDTFPTVNPREYERASWVRWLALEQAGGGAQCDYDLFCRHPADNGPVAFSVYEKEGMIVYEGYRENACPSLVTATPEGVRRFIEFVLRLPDGYSPRLPGKDQPMGHFSDMIALREYPGLHTIPLVKQFTEPRFEGTPFVHLSHGSMHPHGKIPRWKFVDEIMAMKEAV